MTHASAPDTQRPYSTREVARLSHLSEWYVRTCVRDGVVARTTAPRARLRFGFEDLLILRMAGRLLEQGASPAQVRRVLRKMRGQFHGEPITGAAIDAVGSAFVARHGGAQWEPLSGQAVLPLAAGGEEAPNGNMTGRTLETHRTFSDARATEDADPDGARELYQQVLSIDPGHVEAHINLGRLHLDAANYTTAIAHFRQAVRLDKDAPLPHFNLAVAHHDAGNDDDAIVSYRAALHRDPMFAEAHFNLAALFEERDDTDAALQHLQAYRLLARGSHNAP